MKTRALYLVMAFFVLLPPVLDAQVGNMLRNRLNKVVNAGAKTADKELNNKVDTAVQREADNIRAGVEADQGENAVLSEPDEGDSQRGQGQAGAGFGKLFGNKVDLKYKENYGFTSRIYMQAESYEDKDVVKMDYFMYYSAASPSVGLETRTISNDQGDTAPVSAQMVMDGENKSFIMLTDVNGMKMGIISAIPDENTDQMSSSGKPARKSVPPVFTKTANTRVIAGYKCDEYNYTDSENKTTGKVWFTNDASLKIDNRGWQNTGLAAFYGNTEFGQGVILATESYDNKGKLESKTETVEINPNFPHTISVTGYTLRQMNMGQDLK